MGRWICVALLAFAGFMASGCSGDKEASEPSPSPTATQAIPTEVAVPPTQTPGFARVPSTVWLIDVTAPKTTFTYQAPDARVFGASFVETPGAIVVDYVKTSDSTPRQMVVQLNGSPVSDQPIAQACTPIPGGVSIGGRSYPAPQCGFMSAGDRWMLYEVVTGQVEAVPGSSYMVDESEMWVLDLKIGVTMKLQEGLRACGGCDGRFGPAYSTNSTHAYFAETGGAGRVWLADLVSGVSTLITQGPGANEIGREPAFSPSGDRIAYIDPSGVLMIEDLSSGAAVRVPGLSSPVGFDSSGAIVFATAGSSKDKIETVLVDASTGDVLTGLSGGPGYSVPWLRPTPARVVATGSGYVAALENAEDCAGTAIYQASAPMSCAPNGVGASVSPDGSQVAYARVTGSTGRAEHVSGQFSNLLIYEIVLRSVSDGSEQVLATGAISSEVPPLLTWNDRSTHVLVRWPVFGGL